MQILLANAKIMFDKADRAAVSKPLFRSVAEMLAAEMAKLEERNWQGNLIAATR